MRQRKLHPWVGLALAFCVAFGGCEKRQETKVKGNANPPLTVEIARLQPQSFRETLTANGTLVARESVQLQSERAGIVKEILFAEGKLAKAGDVLLTIDDSELQAQLARAKAQLSLASTVEARQRNLLESKGISAAEFDQSRANLDIAKAEVKLIETQLAKTRIRAPFDGVAGLRNASVGTYLTPGTAVCSFQDVGSLKMDFTLPERYLGYTKPGQGVSFRIAGRAEVFEAVIAAIEPTVDVLTRTFQVRATFKNEGTKLLPGSFAEVEVVLEEIPDAILIPAIALVPGLQKQTVFVHRNGQAELRTVQVGIRSAATVQIISGLSAGEELITSGILQLRPGMKVQPKRVETKAAAAAAPPAAETGARVPSGQPQP